MYLRLDNYDLNQLTDSEKNILRNTIAELYKVSYDNIYLYSGSVIVEIVFNTNEEARNSSLNNETINKVISTIKENMEMSISNTKAKKVYYMYIQLILISAIILLLIYYYKTM